MLRARILATCVQEPASLQLQASFVSGAALQAPPMWRCGVGLWGCGVQRLRSPGPGVGCLGSLNLGDVCELHSAKPSNASANPALSMCVQATHVKHQEPRCQLRHDSSMRQSRNCFVASTSLATLAKQACFLCYIVLMLWNAIMKKECVTKNQCTEPGKQLRPARHPPGLPRTPRSRCGRRPRRRPRCQRAHSV